MSAFLRIYTQLGKEHICTIEAYKLSTDNTLTLYDDKITHIIRAGQPCNIHIRNEDQEIESECRLEGVTTRDDNTLQYKNSTTNIIRYRIQNEL